VSQLRKAQHLNADPGTGLQAELEEGPRLATWVTGPAPEALRIGMPVEVWFDGSALK